MPLVLASGANRVLPRCPGSLSGYCCGHSRPTGGNNNFKQLNAHSSRFQTIFFLLGSLSLGDFYRQPACLLNPFARIQLRTLKMGMQRTKRRLVSSTPIQHDQHVGCDGSSSFLFFNLTFKLFPWEVKSEDDKRMDALNASLRRLCTPKRASGRLEVSQEIHRQWKQGGAQRQALLDVLIKAGGDKDTTAYIWS